MERLVRLHRHLLRASTKGPASKSTNVLTAKRLLLEDRQSARGFVGLPRTATTTKAGLRLASAEGKKKGNKMLELWKTRMSVSMSKAEREFGRGWNYIQVASCDEEGQPANRTVVFRSWEADKECLTFITDRRSDKIKHFLANPACEVVWWFPKTNEQYRITGRAVLTWDSCEDEALVKGRVKAWRALSDTAREAFFMQDPNQAIAPEFRVDKKEIGIPVGGRGKDGQILPPPDTFVHVMIWVQAVKYLKVYPVNYAQNDTLDPETGVWTSQRVTT